MFAPRGLEGVKAAQLRRAEKTQTRTEVSDFHDSHLVDKKVCSRRVGHRSAAIEAQADLQR
jgi:hypothetical protein